MTTKTINSISRVAVILQCISNGAERTIDIASVAGLGVSTTHRLLKSLLVSDLIQRDPITKRYYLGSFLYLLASKSIDAHKVLIISSYTEMKNLASVLMETVTLNVPMGIQRICLEEVSPPTELKYTAGKGSMAPIYVAAAGKMLMASMSNAETQMILKNIPSNFLQQNNNINNKDSFFEELERIRKEGYAITIGERIPECAGIAMAVKGYKCPVSICVLGPENRFLKKIDKVIEELQNCVIRISENLEKPMNL